MKKKVIKEKKEIVSKRYIDPKIQRILDDNQMGIRLDLACGGKKQPGFVGIDYRKEEGVDIIHDLEKFPWPLPNECATLAMASHIVEHINPHGGVFIAFINEVWRVLKPGGEFLIAAPYATSQGMFRDPTHCNFINEETWCYFDPLDKWYKSLLYEIYRPLPWEIKFNTWHENGNIEVVLVKRRIDPSYHVDQDFLNILK